MSNFPATSAAAVPLRCENCAVRRRGICSALPLDQLEKLSNLSRRRAVPANHYIFRDGDEANSFASITSGTIKLIKTTASGEQHIIGLMYAPEFLGHTFSEQHRFSAAAATDVELCTYQRPAFARLTSEHPSIERWLFRFTAHELDLCRDWTLMLGRKSSYERVASLLFMMARRQRLAEANGSAMPDSTEFELPLSRSELADYLGLTLETVSRKISRLKAKGVIELRGTRYVRVPNVELLSAIANLDSCGDEEAETSLLDPPS
jgi:CRP/FNR family transcriptional regulator